MSALRCAPTSRPPVGQFGEVGSGLRLQLCSVPEDPTVRVGHVAALVAFTPTVMRAGTRMRIRFEDEPTATWLTKALAHRDVELLAGGGDSSAVMISNPQPLLGRYGFRGDLWKFGRGSDAAVGICRGALHAGAAFNRQGMKISCPTTSLMLTLTAVMARLGITTNLTGQEPRLAISPGEVPFAMQRLGIGDVGDHYTQLRQTPPSTITKTRRGQRT